MSGAAAPLPAAAPDGGAGPGPLPRWLPWLLVLGLALPFDPYWVDFEQVRRALLLLLAAVALLAAPRLPPLPAGRPLAACWLFLLLAAGVTAAADHWFRPADQPPAFQPAEAALRLLHWLALGVLLRVGAAAPRGFAAPLATALLLTAAYGLLQRLGLAAFCGYGVEREPVASFGNLNVASEWTALAALAVAVLGTGRRWLAPTALGLGAAYLAVNQSRSGLVALPVGLLLLALLRRRDGGLRTALAAAAPALAGLLLGGLAAVAAPLPAPADPAAAAAAASRNFGTLLVRREIAIGTAKLFAENPVFGHGPGQFAVHYPRVRSQLEIEASSQQRQFATEVRTAHDDWLELLVEGGLPALLLFAAALFALQRGQRDRARLVPLFALLLLMLVRAPLGNAPALLAPLLLAGAAAPAAAPRRRHGWWRFGLAALLLAAGLPVLVAHHHAARYTAAAATGGAPPPAALATAAAWMPWEPRWLQLLAQEQLAAQRLAEARVTAARAAALRPFEPQLYLLLGEVLARGGAYAEAERLAAHALRFDPPNPELRVLRSAALLQAGRVDDAVLAVAEAPHPALRRRLAAHFGELAAVAAARGQDDAARRCRFEQRCLGAIDSLGDTRPPGLAATSEQVKLLLGALRDAGRTRSDLRFHATAALHYLELGDRGAAEDLGKAAAALPVGLPAWQRGLFGDKLQPLQELPAWRPVLQRP